MARPSGSVKRMLTLTMCWGIALTPLGATAQERQAPPPILKGGIVHQLRSLTEEALDNLDGRETSQQPNRSTVRSAGGQRRPPRVTNNPLMYPPQPTGRAVLQRTHSSPWLERFVTRRKSDGQSTAQASGRPAPTTGSPAANRRSPAQVVAPPPAPVHNRPENTGRLAEVVTPDQLRRERLQPGSGNQVAAGREAEVHVMRQLPPQVRDSLQGRAYQSASRYSTSGTDAPEQRGIGSIPESSPLADRSSATRDQVLLNTGGSVATANSAREDAQSYFGKVASAGQTGPNEQSTTIPAVATQNRPPKVSRIPLPSRSDAGAAPNRRVTEQRVTEQRIAAQRSTEQRRPADASEVNRPSPNQRGVQTPGQSDGQSSVSKSPQRGGVSVPTQLIAAPSAEQAARRMAQTRPQERELPSLPAAGNSSSVPRVQPMQDNPSVAKNKSGSKPAPASPKARATLSDTPGPSSSLAADSRSSLPPPREPVGGTSDERLRLQTPRIQVTLNGPSDLPVGVPADYSIVVMNDDRIDLNGLILRLDIPPGVAVQAGEPSQGAFDVERTADGATLVTWAFDRLPAGNQAAAPVQILAQAARNFAVAMEWTLVPVEGQTQVAVRAPRLELALDGPAEVRFGEPNTYQLRLRNAGDAVASEVAVQLTAEPYGASTSKIGDLAPGEEETVNVELTFNQRGAISIAAEASATGDVASQTAIDVLVRQARLETLIEAPRVVYHGTSAEYKVRVENTGDAPATNVQAMLTLPAGADAVRIPSQGQQSDRVVMWTIPVVGAGETYEETLQLNLSQAGENQVQLECNSSQGKTSASALTLVQAVADLKLLVSDPIAPAPVGSEVLYELELTNRGSKAANNVKVVAQFSEGIEPSRGEGHAYRVVPGQVLFEPIASIAAGETIRLRVFAQAEQGGIHRFRADVRTDETEVRLVQEESTRFLNPNASRLATPGGQTQGVLR